MWWVNLLIGLLAGVVSGMGIGGGTILIPALLFFSQISQQTAQGVNLLYFIPTAIIALIVHIKNRNVAFRIAWPIMLLGVLGAVGGSLLAIVLDGGILKKLFGGFLLLMGIYEFFKKDKKNNQPKKEATPN